MLLSRKINSGKKIIVHLTERLANEFKNLHTHYRFLFTSWGEFYIFVKKKTKDTFYL